VWVDGELLPASDRHLSAFDRGFQLGDGIFETLRATAGRSTELAEHLARLHRSAKGLDIDLPADIEDRVASGIDALLAADRLDGPDGDASIRITVSRGAFRSRGVLPPDEVVPATVVIQAWPVLAPPADHLSRGLSLVASSVRRDPDADHVPSNVRVSPGVGALRGSTAGPEHAAARSRTSAAGDRLRAGPARS
jgi:branched-subunit amino acid aminotransferase/4-amino-4-deoxychorismate lyase